MIKAIRIAVEGTDGAGKTTALKYMIERLQARGNKVLETREVGNPHIPVCVKLRELVLSPDSGLSGEAMEMVFGAMRFENDRFYKQIGNEYDFIVSDRDWLSHLAYTDHNVSEAFTKKIYLDGLKDLTQMPDLVVYFSVNTETALKRRIKRGEGMDVIEMKGVEFQNKVRDSFEKYINDGKNSTPGAIIVTIDANQTIEGVRSQIDDVVEILTTSPNELTEKSLAILGNL
jgi:dTMP kinase